MLGSLRVSYHPAMEIDEDELVFITVGELNEMNRRLRRLERLLLGRYLGPIGPRAEQRTKR